jgi:tape measure domain-containing protein
MNDNKLEIVLAVRDLATGAFKEISGGTNALTNALKSQENSIKSLTGTWNVLFKSAIGVVGINAIKSAAGSMVNLGLQMDSLQRSMKAATGSAEASNSTFSFLKKTSDDLGLSFQSVIRPYMQLAAAARGTNLEGEKTRAIFTAVTEAATVMGLGGSQVERVLYALQQMMAKGTVSMEELRQQLGDQLPGAFQIAARAMGMSTQQLAKMVEEGKIYSDDFLPKFAAQMRKEFGGSVKDASQSARAQLERFNNAIFDVKTALSSTLLPAVTTFLKTTTPLVKEATDYWTKFFESMYPSTADGALQKQRKGVESQLAFARNVIEQWTRSAAKNGPAIANSVIGDKQQWDAKIALLEGQLRLIDETLSRKSDTPQPKTTLPPQPFVDPKAADKAKKEYEKFLKEVADLQKEAWKSIGSDESGQVMPNQAKNLEKALEDVKKAEEDAAKKAVQEQEKAARQAEKLAGDRASAYKTMAREMAKTDNELYSLELELLKNRRIEYEKLGLDRVQIDEWYARQTEEILDRQTYAYGNLFDGIRLGLKGITQETTSWAQVSHAAITGFATGSRNALSDLMFDGIKGDMQEFSDYWNTAWDSLVRSTTDKVASMAIQAATNIGVSLLGDAAGSVVDWAGSLFAQAGLWNVHGDQVPVIAHEGEMILPRHIADQYRDFFGGFGEMGTALGQGTNLGVNVSKGGFSGAAKGAAQALALGQGFSGAVLGATFGGIHGVASALFGGNTTFGGLGGIVGSNAALALGVNPVAGLALGIAGMVAGNLIADALDARVNEAYLDLSENIFFGDNPILGALFGYGSTSAPGALVAALNSTAFAEAFNFSDIGLGQGMNGFGTPSGMAAVLGDAFGDLGDIGGFGDAGFGGFGGSGDGGFGAADAGDAGAGGEWATGTGPKGVPKTGWHYLHRGEIVFNPAESEAFRRNLIPYENFSAIPRGERGAEYELLERMVRSQESTLQLIEKLVSGGGNMKGLTVNVNVAGERFETYVRRIADQVRVEAESRNMGTRRIYL